MRTYEQQFQSLVGKLDFHVELRRATGKELKIGFTVEHHALMTKEVDERVTRGGEQPGLGILRNAVTRPGGQGLEQSLAQRIFSTREVARVYGKIGHEAAVRFA